ncbi:endonuclease III [Candidatus Pantoea edessiphila]|uniref:Endonuclease III n=1 Tax=Candidatus Pantoea edessiphila TaxID=2044610 RepID=A0A2P5SYR6_9GAMM|nr:endonuclease III [Candidatus Pantoea edessiphila]MBK4775396.1 endonuclease III [Pantoea sp. Edef]PPI87474.1 endonuclease III [Candidatus Pantoea edessiphila]
MKQKTRIEILSRFSQVNPRPIIELNFCSPFELLISTLLSSQSTDIMVNKVTKKLYLKANTPISVLKLGLNNIKKYIKPIGLYNIKALNIIKICHILIEKHNGKIPNNRMDLEKLPGIGPKIAGVILNTIFNEPVIAVDTHVFRFCNRTNFALGKNVKQVEDKLFKVVPVFFKKHCHLWIVLHGRYICKSRNPKCNECIIKDLCNYYKIINT